jgi:photosystem II stability/assembly factor-like uncharacterized protein
MIKTPLRIALCALVCLAALRAGGQPLAGTWSNNGPEGTYQPQLVVDPSNSSVLYLPTSAGLFKSTDGGGHWSRIANAGAFALNRSRPSELLLLDSLAGLRRSNDGGTTWTPLAGPKDSTVHHFSGVTFDGNMPSAILLLERVGPVDRICFGFETLIYRSRDDGGSWGQAFTFGPYCQPDLKSTARFVPDDNAVWIVDLIGSLHKISNGELSTAAVALPSPVNAVGADPRDPQRVYAGVRSGVMRSDDGGGTWAQTSMNSEVTALLVNGAGEVFTRSGTVWFVSGDGGIRWLPFTTSVDLVAVDKSNPLLLYGSLGTELVKSTDHGIQWLSIVNGLLANQVSAVAVDPLRGGRAYAGAGPDLFRTDDGGETSSRIGSIWPRTIQALAIEPLSEKLYAATDGGEVLGSSDGGATWRPLLPGSASPVSLALAASSPGTLYVAREFVGPFYRTSDGGDTWTVVPGVSFVQAVAVDPRDSNVVYADDGTLKKSTDGAATWRTLSLPFSGGEISVLAIDPLDTRNVYIESSVGGLLRSSDAGLTWAPTIQSLISPLAIHPSHPGELLGIGYGGNVLRSLDYGKSWRILPNAPRFLSVLAIDSVEDKVFVGGNTGVFTYSPLTSRAPHRVRPVMSR